MIAGDLDIDGILNVDLLNGYELGLNQEYLIADVDGITTGQFIGYDEGDLVASFTSGDLFISYTAGDGNDIALFTSVPEPGSFVVCFALGLCVLGRRKRLRK